MSFFHDPHSGFAGEGKLPQYFPIYERHFSRFVNLSPVVLEIGVGNGNSQRLWRDYFGPNASIFGVEIDRDREGLAVPDGKIFIGDQGDTEFLQRVVDRIGPIDIVIDDGGHDQRMLKVSFDFLWPHLTRHGVYLIEDTHVGYTGHPPPNHIAEYSFNEVAKQLTDEVNAIHFDGHRNHTDFQRTLMSMHFYESIIVFEKGDNVANKRARKLD